MRGKQLSQIDLRAITETTPLRLEIAATIAFADGSIKKSTLISEAQKGKLVIFKIGNVQMTTLADIRAMVELCRVPAPIADEQARAKAALAGAKERVRRIIEGKR